MTRFGLNAAGVSLAAMLLGAASAHAGEPTGDYYAYGPAWAGFYAGAHAGIAFSEVEFKFSGIRESDEDTDLIGGLQLGYNWIAGSTLYGLEADWTFLSSDVASFRGRLGKIIGDKLFYGTAGLAFIDESGVDTTGFVIGGGVDFDLTQRWNNVTAGVEGLYYDFEDDLCCGGEVEASALSIRARVNYHFGKNVRDLQ